MKKEEKGRQKEETVDRYEKLTMSSEIIGTEYLLSGEIE